MLPCREVLSQKVVRPKGDMPDVSHSHMDVESPDATYDLILILLRQVPQGWLI